MELGYQDKTILVTAASKGLGKACAQFLTQEGANVIISSRSIENLQAVADEIEGNTGIRVTCIPADISQTEGVAQLFEQLTNHTSSLDGMICNAGGPPSGSFETFSDEDWIKAFDTNLLSVVRLVRGALPLMEEKGGRIVSIASSSVKVPIPGLILSNVMRAGVQGLMKTLSIELGEKGILLNTVCPGRIATDRVEEIDTASASKQGRTLQEVQEQMKRDIPLGRYGKPEEFAQLVSYLLSPANTYLTGSTYMVDGGMVKAL